MLPTNVQSLALVNLQLALACKNFLEEVTPDSLTPEVTRLLIGLSVVSNKLLEELLRQAEAAGVDTSSIFIPPVPFGGKNENLN